MSEPEWELAERLLRTLAIRVKYKQMIDEKMRAGGLQRGDETRIKETLAEEFGCNKTDITNELRREMGEWYKKEIFFKLFSYFSTLCKVNRIELFYSSTLQLIAKKARLNEWALEPIVTNSPR